MLCEDNDYNESNFSMLENAHMRDGLMSAAR